MRLVELEELIAHRAAIALDLSTLEENEGDPIYRRTNNSTYQLVELQSATDVMYHAGIKHLRAELAKIDATLRKYKIEV